MIQWLQKSYNIKPSEVVQKAELESLRKQVLDYRKKSIIRKIKKWKSPPKVIPRLMKKNKRE